MDDFFESERPSVTLVGAISSPYDLSIATARTCYSSQGIITPEQVSQTEEARLLRDQVAASTLEAGHVTTRQHAHFVFAIDNVSRCFLWNFLHSHPFYNSEQVSQRYVKVKGDRFTIPSLKASEKKRYRDVLALQMGAYETLIRLLAPAVEREYYRIFPRRNLGRQKRWERVIQKKTYEVARYILPIATQAYLYHTISALTLLRYHCVSQSPEASAEQKFVVQRMIDEVVRSDPDFKREVKAVEASYDLQSERGVPPSTTDARNFTAAFDRKLDGRVSMMIDHSHSPIQSMAEAVRLALARTSEQMSDAEALARVLDPAHNRDLGQTINVTTLSPISRALSHAHFTFLKKISHTADSQNQRHRMTPGTRPRLSHHYFGEPDLIYPKLMLTVPASKRIYDDVTEQTVTVMNDLLQSGVPFEKVQYLMPNGWAVRFEESGDLLNWHHKWKLRTCYNAQEEIFFASVEELKQVSEMWPEIGKHLLAPCYLRKRASLTPFCPEGDRYCGIPVWNRSIHDYQRLI